MPRARWFHNFVLDKTWWLSGFGGWSLRLGISGFFLVSTLSPQPSEEIRERSSRLLLHRGLSVWLLLFRSCFECSSEGFVGWVRQTSHFQLAFTDISTYKEDHRFSSKIIKRKYCTRTTIFSIGSRAWLRSTKWLPLFRLRRCRRQRQAQFKNAFFQLTCRGLGPASSQRVASRRWRPMRNFRQTFSRTHGQARGFP